MKIYVFILLLLFPAILTYGQFAEPQEIDLTNLQVPNSPAFMLLDVAPTQIERPTSGKAFALSILNSVNENNGIPQNYAVEFTPYWYFKHRNLNAFKYWGIDPITNKNKGFNQIKLANISFAYVNTEWQDTTITGNINNLAIGVRTTVFQIISKKNRKDLDSANAKIVERLKKVNELAAAFDPSDMEVFKAKVKVLLDSISTDETMLAYEKEMQDILNRKPLFAIDGATAINWSFDGNNFSSSQLSLFGAWLTFDFSLELNPENNEQRNYVSFLMLTRYTYDNSLDGNPLTDGDFMNLFDLGGRFAFEFKQLLVSYEYIFRTATGQSIRTFRSTGMAMYKVSDKIYLLATLGKNFGDTNNLIAQFGINLGFGTGNEKVWTVQK